MRRKELFSYFNGSPYFTKQALALLVEKFSISRESLNTHIQRAIKNKEIIKLKNGLYVTSDFYKSRKGNLSYAFYISNVLLPASYVSRESALQYYGLLSEGAYRIIMAIAKKTPRRFNNNLGVFEYRKIKDSLFKGFVSRKDGEFSFLIAEPYKAIYDYLYYRFNLSNFELKNLKAALDEYRIDYDELPKSEMNKLIKTINERKDG